MAHRIVSVPVYVTVFALLLLLTGLTTWIAFIDLGPMNTVVALVIAVTKMVLVILFFMHVRYSDGLTRIVILAGFFWLAILIALTLSDFLTRHWSPLPSGWSESTKLS